MYRCKYTKNCDTCGKEFTNTHKHYKSCSKSCANSRYKLEARNYIKEHWGKKTPKEIAEHLGINERNLVKFISLCRNNNIEGMVFPKMRNTPVGTVKEYTHSKRGKYKVIKTDTGWKYLGTVPKPRAPRTSKEEHIKKDNTMASNRTAYRGNERYNRNKRIEDRRMPTRVITLVDKKRVYIPELKMNVYVKQGESEADVRAKWLQHRENELKGYAKVGF